jgi:hypothetical protein
VPKTELKLLAPIGKVPSQDEDLEKRMKKLPSDATLSDIGEEIDAWEKSALRKFKSIERTAASGKLDTNCW